MILAKKIEISEDLSQEFQEIQLEMFQPHRNLIQGEISKQYIEDQIEEVNNLPEFAKKLQEEEIATMQFINITKNEIKSPKRCSYVSLIIDRKFSLNISP